MAVLIYTWYPWLRTYDAVNDNLPEVIEIYGNNSRKITCDYYIDDKAVLPATFKSH